MQENKKEDWAQIIDAHLRKVAQIIVENKLSKFVAVSDFVYLLEKMEEVNNSQKDKRC